MTATDTATEAAILTARASIAPGTLCDRCRMAPAQARVTFVTGSTLYLCGHHYRKHAARLTADVTTTIHTELRACNCFQCTPVSERPKV